MGRLLMAFFLVVSVGVLAGCEKEGDTLFNPDTYDAGPTPQISSVDPADSIETEGEVTIQGANFSSSKEANYVYFGSKTGEILEASASELKVKAPSDSLGEVTLRVSTSEAVDFSNSVTYKVY